MFNCEWLRKQDRDTLTLNAIFNGMNGSCGFIFGEEYRLKLFIKHSYLFIMDLKSGKSCPYDSLESFLANWALVD